MKVSAEFSYNHLTNIILLSLVEDIASPKSKATLTRILSLPAYHLTHLLYSIVSQPSPSIKKSFFASFFGKKPETYLSPWEKLQPCSLEYAPKLFQAIVAKPLNGLDDGPYRINGKASDAELIFSGIAASGQLFDMSVFSLPALTSTVKCMFAKNFTSMDGSVANWNSVNSGDFFEAFKRKTSLNRLYTYLTTPCLSNIVESFSVEEKENLLVSLLKGLGVNDRLQLASLFDHLLQ